MARSTKKTELGSSLTASVHTHTRISQLSRLYDLQKTGSGWTRGDTHSKAPQYVQVRRRAYNAIRCTMDYWGHGTLTSTHGKLAESAKKWQPVQDAAKKEIALCWLGNFRDEHTGCYRRRHPHKTATNNNNTVITIIIIKTTTTIYNNLGLCFFIYLIL